MLMLETKCGNFGRFKDLLLFMQEEHLDKIEITRISYCLETIGENESYTIEEIKKIVEDI